MWQLTKKHLLFLTLADRLPPQTVLDQFHIPHYFGLFFRLQTYEIRFILFDRKGRRPLGKYADTPPR